MARFIFRLQSVLDLREKLEDQKELEYAQALRQVEEERAKERALQKQKADCLGNLAARLGGEGEASPIDPHEVARYNDFIDVLKERITAQQKAVHAAEQFAEVKRKELVEAMRARKTIEKLRENALEEYTEEEKRGEQKQVDEVVSYKYSKL
jgi:flagellar FliJ protein